MAEAALDRLRACGLHLREPLRFHYLEVLAQRAESEHGALQARLQGALARAIAMHLGEVANAQEETTPGAAPPDASAPPCPLARLNAELASRTQLPEPAAGLSLIQTNTELASAKRFGATWSKVAVERQLAQSLANAPANAGPLNSQRLVLQALHRMRQLSPDYLNRFVASASNLAWLQDSAARLPRSTAKAARRSVKGN